MTDKCPHGYPHPLPSIFKPESSALPRRDNVKMRVISDSGECPDCLQAQIQEANNIINRIFFARGHIDVDIFGMMTEYITRYKT